MFAQQRTRWWHTLAMRHNKTGGGAGTTRDVHGQVHIKGAAKSQPVARVVAPRTALLAQMQRAVAVAGADGPSTATAVGAGPEPAPTMGSFAGIRPTQAIEAITDRVVPADALRHLGAPPPSEP